MLKVLFLDIDGVLNSQDNEYSRLYLWRMEIERSRDKYGDLFDERCVRWLRLIVEKTDCKIVISSSWRRSGLETMQDLWHHRKLPGQVIDITPLTMSEYLVNLYADTEADRGYEIQEWINLNNPDSYCIVDDMKGMLKHQNFVQTDSLIGLDLETSKQIIRILNNGSN